MRLGRLRPVTPNHARRRAGNPFPRLSGRRRPYGREIPAAQGDGMGAAVVWEGG